jgi:hypothetical protein
VLTHANLVRVQGTTVVAIGMAAPAIILLLQEAAGRAVRVAPAAGQAGAEEAG